MRAVNLLPRDKQARRLDAKRTPLLVGAAGAALVTAAAVFAGLSASGKADDRRAELEAVRSAIARLPKVSQPAVSATLISRERSDRIAALSVALSNRVSFDRVLRQISLVLPDDAWLTGLTAMAPATSEAQSGASQPTPTTTTEGVTIDGATYSQESVARVLSRLSVVPTLQEVRLTATAVVEPASVSATDKTTPPAAAKRKKVVTFSISASLRTVRS